MQYAGKDISSLDLPQLEGILKGLCAAERERDKARSHQKFDKTSNKKALEFPNINPAFIQLKNSIEEEIRKRRNV